MFGFLVVPVDGQQWRVHRISRTSKLFANALAQLVEEPQITLGIAWWICGLETPLQHALGLGKGTGLFYVRCCRQKEDLGANIFGLEFTSLDLW